MTQQHTAVHRFNGLRTARILWFLFAVFIIYGTTIPFNIIAGGNDFLFKVGRINWIPFVDLDGSRASFPDMVQNILLFLPFGFFGFLAVYRKPWVKIFAVAFLGAMLSLTVELLQLLTVDRTTSVTDLVTNSIGALLGAVAANSVANSFSQAIRHSKLQKYMQPEFTFPFFIAGLVVAAGMLEPFDFTLDFGHILSKIKKILHALLSIQWVVKDEAVVFLRFFLFAYIGSIYFWQLRLRRPVMNSILLSISIGLFLEGNQLIISSRMPTTQDSLVVILGSICGGFMVLHHPMRLSSRQWAYLSVLAFFFAAAIQTLSPFQLAENFRTMNWMPFLPHYGRSVFFAFSNFIEVLLVFYPMGFLVQYLLNREQPIYITIGAMTLFLAVPLELFQGFIIDRYPDITDIFGAVTGSLAGAWTCVKGWPAFRLYSGHPISGFKSFNRAQNQGGRQI